MQMLESSRSLTLFTSTLAVALLALALALPAFASDTVYAQGSDVVVYQSPTAAANEVARLSAGEAVLSHGAEGEWVNIDVDVNGESVNGWIHEAQVGVNPPN